VAQVDVTIQLAGVASCKFVVVGVVVAICTIFGSGLPINRINSLHLINIRRTARFRSFEKKHGNTFIRASNFFLKI